MPILDTWDALAVALNMPVREIYRARKLPGAPEGKDLDEWREYFKQSNSLDLSGLTPTSYDKALASGKLDPDAALKHSRIVEQEIINEIKREELRKIRGDALTKEQHREILRSLAEKIKAAVATLPDEVAKEFEPHERAGWRKRAETWRDRILILAVDALNRG